MAKTIMEIGKIGSGKTASLRNLPPKETLIISIDGKEVSWLTGQRIYKTRRDVDKNINWDRTNFIKPKNYGQVPGITKHVNDKLPRIKYLVFDTYSNLLNDMYAAKCLDAGYVKFAEMGKHVWEFMRYCQLLRDDLYVIFLWHTKEDVDPLGVVRKDVFIPAGKMLEDKNKPASIIDVIVESTIDNEAKGADRYIFNLVNNGNNIVRLPLGLLDGVDKIPNDIMLIINELEKVNSSGDDLEWD